MAKGNNNRGITHISPDESGGGAGSPNFSQAHTGSGFAWGIDMISKNTAVPGAPNSSRVGMKAGNNVWHPGACKP